MGGELLPSIHCKIEDFSMIFPGAVVRNSVKIDSGTWIKANEVME